MDTRESRLPTRRLRIFLRDFRLVEATASIAEGQALASYFASRKTYINVTDVQWSGTGDSVAHAVLKVEQVLWAASSEGDIQLTNASIPSKPRPLRMQLDGGLLVQGGLALGEGQRLSDYLEMAGHFLPILNAQLLRSGRPPKEVNLRLGDVVLNQDAVQAVWEIDPSEPEPLPARNVGEEARRQGAER